MSEAWAVAVAGGEAGAPEPAAGGQGTRVEVRDLFFKVPARLKFLRSERAEAEAAEEAVRRLALARPELAFSLAQDGRIVFRAEPAGELFGDALLHRLAAVMGREFVANAIEIEAERDGIGLRGYAGLPTFSRRDARAQHLFVNRRPVQDRLLQAGPARRLQRSPVPRPPAPGGAVPRAAAGAGRRQRPPGQGRGALSRARPGPRPRRRRAQAGAGRARPPQRRRRTGRARVPSARRTAPPRRRPRRGRRRLGARAAARRRWP